MIDNFIAMMNILKLKLLKRKKLTKNYYISTPFSTEERSTKSAHRCRSNRVHRQKKTIWELNSYEVGQKINNKSILVIIVRNV